MKIKKQKFSHLRSRTIRVARAHFLYVLIFAITIMLYDSWRLIAYEQTLQRWTLVVVMMFISTAAWYASRYQTQNDKYYKVILMVLIVLDIFVASYTVYLERGMASSSVILYSVPIIISALISRAAIFATAGFCLAAYSLALFKYFYLEPAGEGIRVQLYGSLFLYGSSFFILAAILYIVRTRDKIVD